MKSHCNRKTKKEQPMALLHQLLLLLLLLIIPFSHSQDPLGNYCNKPITTTTTSANIERTLTELSTKAPQKSFATSIIGKGAAKVYGLAQCRQDVSANACQSCVNNATKNLRNLCPNESDGRIWYDYCFVRYNTQNFIGELDTGYGIFYYNTENVTDPKAFDKRLGALMDDVEAQAVKPGNRGLGKGEAKVSPFVTVYGLVQCTQDLEPLLCAQCAATAVGTVFPEYCLHRKGCRVLYSSCYVRYEIYPFFFPVETPGTSAVGESLEVVVARP
ncbi:Cysteine-rich repeat secretory protein 55 [Acorus calamus]|uniref:Cysteine-rich repeat secretory protein 55 n=1 Tax=Acorus calamus TaxID=4465 RepID=A0AAV9CIA0_ACOCL|nr:Cysteine-rich repeat secretory protein 55 [Acorus calamus]